MILKTKSDELKSINKPFGAHLSSPSFHHSTIHPSHSALPQTGVKYFLISVVFREAMSFLGTNVPDRQAWSVDSHRAATAGRRGEIWKRRLSARKNRCASIRRTFLPIAPASRGIFVPDLHPRKVLTFFSPSKITIHFVQIWLITNNVILRR